MSKRGTGEAPHSPEDFLLRAWPFNPADSGVYYAETVRLHAKSLG